MVAFIDVSRHTLEHGGATVVGLTHARLTGAHLRWRIGMMRSSHWDHPMCPLCAQVLENYGFLFPNLRDTPVIFRVK